MAEEIKVDQKKWWKSKTVQTAIVGAILACLQAAGYPIPEWAYGLLGSFGLYALRDGVGKPLSKGE